MKKEEKKPGIISRIKASKYYEAAEEGFWRIWKNKTIWFWGLFISAGTATSFSNKEEGADPVSEEAIANFFSNYWQWLIIGLIIVLILALVAWFVSSVARAGVIQELNKKQNNEKHVLGFKKIWKIGLKDFKTVLGLDLFMLGILFLALLVNSIMVIPFFLLENKIIPGVIIFVVIFASLSILFGMAILKPFAQVSLLLANLSCKEAFLRGWRIIRNNLREFFKLVLTCFAISFIEGLFFAMVSIFATIVGGILYLIIYNIEGFTVGVALTIIGSIFLVTILAIVLTICGFFALWRMDLLIWWMKEIEGIKAREVVKVPKVETKKETTSEKVAVGANA